MVTALAQVAVTRDGTRFRITCNLCPDLDLTRVMRIDADLAATSHARSHARPSRADEVQP